MRSRPSGYCGYRSRAQEQAAHGIHERAKIDIGIKRVPPSTQSLLSHASFESNWCHAILRISTVVKDMVVIDVALRSCPAVRIDRLLRRHIPAIKVEQNPRP